jgi:hypothetical protein
MGDILRIVGPAGKDSEVVPGDLRGLAIVSGCLTAVSSSLMFGLGSSISAGVLILAAMIQPCSGRPGKWLMWLGAFFLSINGVFLASAVPSGVRTFRVHPGGAVLAVLSLSILSVLVQIWCDVRLIADAIKQRYDPEMAAAQSFTRVRHWRVWVTAIFLTVWVFQAGVRSLFLYRRYNQPGGLVLSLVLGITIVWFDVVLAINAAKMRRNRSILP